MPTAAEPLPDNVEQLQALLLAERQSNTEKDDQILSLRQENQFLLEQFRLAQHKQFGQSHESANQLGLFNEVEQVADDMAAEAQAETEQVAGYRRNKPRRQRLPDHLARERVIHDLDEADKVCDSCGHDLHCMGEERSEQLEIIPPSFKVIEHVRPKYSCRHCEQEGIESRIKIAPAPPQPIPKSFASPSILAHIISSKYQYAIPLNRLENMFGHYGVDISRKTQADWMIKVSELFKPVYWALKALQLQQRVIFADESPLKVIHADKSKCYMWVYCTGTDSPPDHEHEQPPNIVLYDYRNSRSGQCPIDYLGDYNGYLQVDGYAGYEQTDATLAGCWSHARRKFVEAKKAQAAGKTGKADWALNHIQKLYAIESGLKKGRSPEEKRQQRAARAKPLLDQFKTWLDKSSLQVPPKSAVGKAIAYSLNQWTKLIRYVEDGHLNIDNNRAERAIKPFVIGRKNWMFSNTARGAHASAILYSIVETARANGLAPYDYLKLLLEELPKQPESLDHLLPWNISLEK